LSTAELETETAEPEYKVGTIEMVAPEGSFTLACDALSYWQHDGLNDLSLLSAAGPHTAVQAFSAALHLKGGRITIRPDVEGMGRYITFDRASSGYRIYRTRLGYNTWHMLAVAKTEQLIPVLSDAALWKRLQESKFTTPLLRDWLPVVKACLFADSLLTRLNCFQCEAAVLTASTDDLDRIVGAALRDRAISIT